MSECEALDAADACAPGESVASFTWKHRRLEIVELASGALSTRCACSGLCIVARFSLDDTVFAVMEPIAHARLGDRESRDPLEVLTERELQIAVLVASGRPTKQIADSLRISEWTVGTHLRRIYAKLGIHTRAALAYRCATLTVPLDQPRTPAPSAQRPRLTTAKTGARSQRSGT